MRKIITVMLLAVLLLPALALRADEASEPPLRRFGVGIVVGDPTGASLAFRFGKEDSVQMHLGWELSRHGLESPGLTVTTDYRHHFISLINPIKEAGTFAPAIGIGAKLSMFEGQEFVSTFGLRIPAQVSFFVAPVPIEVFMEFALGMYIVPQTSALVDGAVGARWYF